MIRTSEIQIPRYTGTEFQSAFVLNSDKDNGERKIQKTKKKRTRRPRKY